MDSRALEGVADQIRDLIERPARHSIEESVFNEQALKLWAIQSEASPLLGALSKQAKSALGRDIKYWKEIPGLPTRFFKESDVSLIPVADRTAVFRSSGTTLRDRSAHPHHWRSLELYRTSVREGLGHFVFTQPTPPRILNLAPSPTDAPESSLADMFALATREFGEKSSETVGRPDPNTGEWRIDLDRAFHFLDGATRVNNPVLILGTAFHFVRLADASLAANLQFRLPAGSAILETGGYKGQSRRLEPDAFAELINAAFGVYRDGVYTEYGMSELSSQAYRLGFFPDNRFEFSPWAQAQILSPETMREAPVGEVGIIQVHDLANVYSCACVLTEDMGRRLETGFEFIGRAQDAPTKGCSLFLE